MGVFYCCAHCANTEGVKVAANKKQCKAFGKKQSNFQGVTPSTTSKILLLRKAAGKRNILSGGAKINIV
jgi:hypothetical protein